VPALLSGLRVLVSTGTRTLQDQLFHKDLPLISGALGRPVRLALLKGRSNYLCLYRLGNTTHTSPQLQRVRQWAEVTRTGDLAEMPGLSDSDPLWPHITTTRENCLGARCPQFGDCHVAAARRAAQEADVVIVNHHLLLADLLLKDDGFADFLGTADAFILDEAHQIPDLAMQLFGTSISSRRMTQLLKEIQQEQPELTQTAAEALADSERGFLARPGRYPAAEWSGVTFALLETLYEAFSELMQQLQLLVDKSPTLSALTQKCAVLLSTLQRFTVVDERDGVSVLTVDSQAYQLSFTPFDIAARFQQFLQARPAAWIFTSASLSMAGSFTHFVERLGLNEADTVQIDSPFDYANQALLYLPPDMPDPGTRQFSRAVLEAAVPLIEAAGGGVFLLFTSHRSLLEGAALLRSRWQDTQPFELYIQGEAPREQLLQAFRNNGNGVLLGTGSFWEGVDVKGRALRLVILEKLPFAAPDDPVVKARIDHLRANGGNPFKEFQLPQAALALKQGVGRLIRSEEDTGVVMICDPRLVSSSYGRQLQRALPPMPVTRDLQRAVQFLRQVA
jgi:ATP-dependent DNA helicase DinG